MKKIFLILLFTTVSFAQSSKMLLLMGDDVPTYSFALTGSSTGGNIIMQGTGTIIVDWGDDSITNYTLTTTDQNVSHTYVVSGTYNVKIKNSNRITKIYINALVGTTYTLNSKNLPNLTDLILYNISGTQTINSFDLPKLTYLLLGLISGAQTINSSDLPKLTYLYLSITAGTLSGNISSFPSTMTRLYTNKSGFDITTGTMPAWANNEITIVPTTAGYTTAQIDGFLNAWASTAAAGTKTIDLRGNNQPRSTASDAAVATLTGLGKTILTNP
ncbi:MAG: hypothetical protein WA138_16085 [Parvibaculum sp.]